MSRRSRTSLSDWWARPEPTSPGATSEGSDSESKGECEAVQASPMAQVSPMTQWFSPSKRSNPSFYIGDGDDSEAPSHEGSPRKKVALILGEAGVKPEMLSAFRGICAEYFESNVMPILRFIQQSQEQLLAQQKKLTGTVDQKVNAEDAHAKQEITSAQLAALAAAVELKMDASDAPDPAEVADLRIRVQAVEQKVIVLNEELQELKKVETVSRSTGSVEPSDIKSVKAVFVAAGLRVDRQLKDMRQQMQQLRNDCLGHDVGNVGSRWPGRTINNSTSEQSVASDNESDNVSIGASAAGSLAASSALDPEEKTELKKIQAILAAAGTAFSRDLREVKNQMRDVRMEMQCIKTHLNEQPKGCKNTLAELH